MLRFAPSPVKDMDLNSLRIAIYNYILSKQLGEDLIIRIEDIDKQNIIEGKDKEILEILNLFSIEYKNVVHQSDSLKYHQKLAMQLMAQKKAFSCFCGDVKLAELKQYDGFCETLSDETVLNTNAPFTVRIKKPQSNMSFNDLIKGAITNSPEEVDSFNILNHDKTPKYNYACAIDDMLTNISMVIRSEDYINETSRQMHIRNQFGYDTNIKYAHLSNILDADISVKELIDEGFLPSAIANYLVLLGNDISNEIFTLEEAISWFKLENISKETLRFDIEKLKEINKKHLETIDDMRLSKILGFADSDIGKLAKLFLEDSNTIKELKEKVDAVFSIKSAFSEFEKEFLEIKDCLSNAPYINDFEELKKYIIEKTNLNGDSLEKPLRYILTGKDVGAKLEDIYPLIKNYLGEIVK